MPKIDLFIGGSPCQGFSFAGKQLNFEDERSRLFFEFIRLLNEITPDYFLLENVRMKKEYQDIISKYIGCEPILINSNLVSAQNRERLYKKANGQLVVLAGYDAMQQSGDMAAPFLQESTFWWLTGIEQPGWKVILDTARGHATLVRPKRSDIDIIFNGESDDAQITAISGIGDIIAEKDFEARLRQLHRKHTIVQTLNPKQSHEFVLNPAGQSLHTALKRIAGCLKETCEKS